MAVPSPAPGVLALACLAVACARGASNGDPTDAAAVPSGVAPPPSAPERMAVKVFFADTKRDPGMLDCGRTYAFERRVPRTPRVGEAAIRELLRGPSAEERERGAHSSIPEGTRLISLRIERSIATVDLSRELAQGVAGSCRVSAIRAQLEQTLLAFPTVKQVQILVEGQDAEPLLQP